MSEEGLATLYRFRAVKFGDRNDVGAVQRNERLHFQIRSQVSAPNKIGNCLLIQLGEMGSAQGKLVEAYELAAKVEDRIFGANGSDLILLKPVDITSMSKDENWAPIVDQTFRPMNANPLALPFLTMDAHYFEKYDFQAAKNRFRLFRIAYQSDDQLRSVWVAKETRDVVEVKLGKESGGLPIETSFYRRDSGKDLEKIKEVEDLGELIYRTQTKWRRLKSKGAKSDPTWVPERIEFEHLPNKFESYVSHSFIEIHPVWRQVDDDLLTLENFQRPIPIENELMPPNEPISTLYYEMLRELNRSIAESKFAKVVGSLPIRETRLGTTRFLSIFLNGS